MNKIVKHEGHILERIPSRCTCIDCFFIDEFGECHSPMPIELGADCIEVAEDGTKHFQYIEIKKL
jgi:hypothetical protein